MIIWFVNIILISEKVGLSQYGLSFVKFVRHFTAKFVFKKEVKVKTWDILNQLQ